MSSVVLVWAAAGVNAAAPSSVAKQAVTVSKNLVRIGVLPVFFKARRVARTAGNVVGATLVVAPLPHHVPQPMLRAAAIHASRRAQTSHLAGPWPGRSNCRPALPSAHRQSRRR